MSDKTRRQLAERVALGFTPLAWGPTAPIFGDREGPGLLGWECFNPRKVVATATGQTAVHGVRNAVVEEFLAHRSEPYLLFCDHDMMYPADLLVHVGAYSAPIVSGVYFQRDLEEPLPVAYHWRDDERRGMVRVAPNVLPRWLVAERGLHPVDVVGAGCLAIRRDVLVAMKPGPWFEGSIGSEDVYFCRRAGDLGFEILLDTWLCCRHLDQIGIGANWYLGYVDAKARELAQKLAAS